MTPEDQGSQKPWVLLPPKEINTDTERFLRAKEAFKAARVSPKDEDPLIHIGEVAVREHYPPVGKLVTNVANYFFRQAGHQTADDRERSLIALFVGHDSAGFYLPVHIYWGLMVDLTIDDIAETIGLAGLYTGLPCYTNAMDKLAATLDLLDNLQRADADGQLNQLIPGRVAGILKQRFSVTFAVGPEIAKLAEEVDAIKKGM